MVRYKNISAYRFLKKIRSHAISLYRKLFMKRIPDREGQKSGWITKKFWTWIKNICANVLLYGVTLNIIIFGGTLMLNDLYSFPIIRMDAIYVIALGLFWWYLKFETRDLRRAWKGDYEPK